MVRGAARSTPALVHRITGARRSLTEDIHSRQVRYLFSMGVRTACFLLAVVTDGYLRWIFFAGAVVLPYVAVVVANAGREQTSAPVGPVAPPTRLQLEAERRPVVPPH